MEPQRAERARWDDIRAQKAAEDPDIERRRVAARARFDFAQLVYDVRTAAGLTQRQLAERMGTKQPAIGRIESAGTAPTVDLLLRLATAVDGKLTVRVEVNGEGHEVSYPGVSAA